ncbi:UDP-N-acetylglucosamine 1-carboxyvinyltransferase [Aliarcobacter butzleri]|uniref:UDP-N-acetylglucosamine 1-carboxyvinyltransferase n=5 Tax=Aliarcobacter butzleri TaxID=28197 RepID=A0AAW7PZK3_9BACT|nr:UDP-N-acetylglucosamine 1-carboxyvinyltransferase [Aliarcobacter butzleri]MCP3650323.1 UDP-N-acetylglucosamine 1-carboxyvinyltransferase [Arcobacter sp. DNRA7]AGR78048.1 UDP-N-acetylglucosamine enolpyruvoyl transferase [Aliarcobacter butzleri 7h1h]KLD98844.1 UDP-N-acetylglucosamine 1-carboxyvinyltransferase [Aliarcobacter butzleri L348]KLE00925.1 UDP-N-acetylglucosamine 1-carboxyvinyltransferase [Aliarcobacter butzleri L351]KLE02963.1 UDP-N-acetylglucosamine 1-carboxyvinyltransferase [Aliar
MEYLKIVGGKDISGSVEISGAKNAALPLIACTILGKNEITIGNLPNVVDINTFLKLILKLGGSFVKEENKVKINTSTINNTTATYDIVKTMRASILVLGPLLARFGHCEVSLPGGCAIGQRPVDLHLKALEQMGAKIEILQGYIKATAPNGLKGAKIVFDKVTVGGTENIVMAAALAHGVTTIINAAKEPEIVQLCEVLANSGVKIEGIGTSKIVIEGTGQKLIDIKPFDVIPDRIEAGTYMCAAAITNKKLKINKVIPLHLEAVISKLEEMNFEVLQDENSVTILPTTEIKPVNIITTEYPGFPTDMQAQFMALATQANGTSTIDERLFENRFMHVSELLRLGADIHLNGNIATINGKMGSLNGTDVMATDLRASSALVLAALVANGETNIHRIYHLDRGYENLEGKLSLIGADVKRSKED